MNVLLRNTHVGLLTLYCHLQVSLNTVHATFPYHVGLPQRFRLCLLENNTSKVISNLNKLWKKNVCLSVTNLFLWVLSYHLFLLMSSSWVSFSSSVKKYIQYIMNRPTFTKTYGWLIRMLVNSRLQWLPVFSSWTASTIDRKNTFVKGKQEVKLYYFTINGPNAKTIQCPLISF